MEDPRRKNRNNGSGYRVLGLVILYLVLMLSRSGASGRVAGIVVLLFVLGAAVAAGLSFVKNNANKGDSVRAGRRAPNQPQPTPPRPQAAPVRVYSDRLREEENARDREMRLRQLDDFLKNGIIDKAEYQVLRRKYEK